MGVDARIEVLGPVSDAELQAARDYLAEHWPKALHWGEGPEEIATRSENGVDLDMGGQRHYGPGYERGHWPTIYEGIRVAGAAFPGKVVTYYGDTSDVGPPVDTEALWAHWLGEHWNDYRKAIPR